ncbi:MAG TPA: hypothetical protein VJK51_04830 [Candidatus Nanoarchaeia archaeon]|nr:hypothetical protein [Candidatus Nanoarchaeia archaeon]
MVWYNPFSWRRSKPTERYEPTPQNTPELPLTTLYPQIKEYSKTYTITPSVSLREIPLHTSQKNQEKTN